MKEFKQDDWHGSLWHELNALAEMEGLLEKYSPEYRRKKKIERILEDLKPHDELDEYDKLMRDLYGDL